MLHIYNCPFIYFASFIFLIQICVNVIGIVSVATVSGTHVFPFPVDVTTTDAASSLGLFISGVVSYPCHSVELGPGKVACVMLM